MVRPVSPRERAKPKGRLRPLVFVGVTLAVFWGSYAAYRYFQVADAEGWLADVLSIFGVVGLVILAAAAAAFLFIALRGQRRGGGAFTGEK